MRTGVPWEALLFFSMLPTGPGSWGGGEWLSYPTSKGLCVDTCIKWRFALSGDALVSLLEGTNVATQLTSL